MENDLLSRYKSKKVFFTNNQLFTLFVEMTRKCLILMFYFFQIHLKCIKEKRFEEK